MIQDKEIKMGRPLNKKFFGAPGSGYEVVCLADVGAGSVTSYIVEQRSNSKYRVAEVATPANTAICKLVDATPAATGEMQVLVTPENAVTPLQATVTFTAAGGTGALATVAIAEAGYGYWTAGTNVAIGGTSDGTINYTVANGSLATVSINTAGTANTNATVELILKKHYKNIGDHDLFTFDIGKFKTYNEKNILTFQDLINNKIIL